MWVQSQYKLRISGDGASNYLAVLKHKQNFTKKWHDDLSINIDSETPTSYYYELNKVFTLKFSDGYFNR